MVEGLDAALAFMTDIFLSYDTTRLSLESAMKNNWSNTSPQEIMILIFTPS